MFDPDESPDVVLDDDSTFQGNPLRTYPPPKLADLQVPEGWANTQQKIVAVMNEYKVSVVL